MPEASDGAPLGDHRLEARSEPLSRRALSSRSGQVSSLPTAPLNEDITVVYFRAQITSSQVNPYINERAIHSRSSSNHSTRLRS